MDKAIIYIEVPYVHIQKHIGEDYKSAPLYFYKSTVFLVGIVLYKGHTILNIIISKFHAF